MDKNNYRMFEAQFICLKKVKNGKRKRQFFLFNDMLIIANGKDRVKQVVSMQTMKVQINEQKQKKNQNEFVLITSDNCQKPNVYLAKSKFELQQIEKIVKKNRDRVWNKDLMQLNANTMKKLLSASKLKQT